MGKGKDRVRRRAFRVPGTGNVTYSEKGYKVKGGDGSSKAGRAKVVNPMTKNT